MPRRWAIPTRAVSDSCSFSDQRPLLLIVARAVKDRLEVWADGTDPFLWEFDRRFGEKP